MARKDDRGPPRLTPEGRGLREAWILLENSRRAANGQPPASSWTRYDGGVDKFTGRTYRPKWDAAAAAAAASGIDPVAVARFVFKTTAPTKVPDPGQIARPEILSAFRVAKERQADAIALRLASDRAAFASSCRVWALRGKGRDEVRRTAVLDAAAGSPLFRFLAATQYALECEARALAGPAAAQYLEHPEAYRHHWADVLTAPALYALRTLSREVARAAAS